MYRHKKTFLMYQSSFLHILSTMEQSNVVHVTCTTLLPLIRRLPTSAWRAVWAGVVIDKPLPDTLEQEWILFTTHLDAKANSVRAYRTHLRDTPVPPLCAVWYIKLVEGSGMSWHHVHPRQQQQVCGAQTQTQHLCGLWTRAKREG